MAQVHDLKTFEETLTVHRRVLVKYLEEWSQRQEAMLERFAYCNSFEEAENSSLRREEDRPEHEPHVQPPRGFHVQPPRRGVPDLIIDTHSHNHVGPGDRAADRGFGEMSHSFPLGPAIQGHSHEEEHVVTQRRPSISSIVDVQGIEIGTDEAALETRPSVERTATGRGRRGIATKIVESSPFSVTLSSVILGNVVFMAIATDHTMDAVLSGGNPNKMLLDVGEAFFTVSYTIELVLRFAAYGIGFFIGREWKWNIFDLIIVCSGLSDLIASSFTTGGVNMSYLRLNRMFKLIKMLRVVKFYRMFKEFRLIIESIIGCVTTMFWAITLLAMVLFLFSLLFVQAVTDHLQSRSPSEWNPRFMTYWGSTRSAMISLFFSTTGGEDWASVAEPLQELGWLYYGAFMIYICFYMFVVVNVLTALFVDAALSESAKDDAVIIQEHLHNKQQYIKQIQAFYSRLRDEGADVLTWQQFEKGMDSPELLAFAASLDIEVSDSQEFFKLISSDGRDNVDIEEFVVGCMKLKGPARSVDMVSLLHRTTVLENVVKKFTSSTDARLQEMQSLVFAMLQESRRKQPIMGCAGCVVCVRPTSMGWIRCSCPSQLNQV